VHRFDLSKNRLGSIRQQPAGVGEPDTAPHALQQGTPTSASSFARWWLTEGWA